MKKKIIKKYKKYYEENGFIERFKNVTFKLHLCHDLNNS